MEAARSDSASVSGGSSVGAGGARSLSPPPRSTSTSFGALKARLPPLQGVATLTSPKLDLFSWLRLQFVADADLATGGFGVRWRVSTKWSASPGRIGRKERVREEFFSNFLLHFSVFFPASFLTLFSLYSLSLSRSLSLSTPPPPPPPISQWPVFDGAELKPRWSVDLYTPEVTGTFGAPQRQLRGGRRRRDAAAPAAAGAGGSANGAGSGLEDEAAAAGPGSAASATDDDDDGASAGSPLSSSATSFRGRRRGARGRGNRAALDLGHCHLLVPRLDAVVYADAAAVSLVKAAKFAAVTPIRVLAGIPLAAARKAAGRVRKRALPPPPPPSPSPPVSGAPFVAPGGLTFPPLPSFLSRPSSARFSAKTNNNVPPQFSVRGWPWSLGLADGLESAARWLRRATEEARERSGKAAPANA